ncbi:MAG: hypothetical protein U0790_17135 [Isosphaeraceae bacterium]
MLAEEVGDDDVIEPVAVVVTLGDPHVGLDLALAVDGDPPAPGDVLEGAVVAVAPEDIGLGVIGDEDVHPAVAVEVRREAAHAPAVPRHARALGDVGEGTVAVVPVKDVGQACELARHPVERAPGLQISAERGLLRVESEVVRHEEVEVAVAVVVEEGGAEAPEGTAHPGLPGGVGETARVVPPEGILAISGDVEVRVAVAVVIGDGHSLAVGPGCEASLAGYVLELMVAQVPEQCVRRRWVFPNRQQPPALW